MIYRHFSHLRLSDKAKVALDERRQAMQALDGRLAS
jgi:hypothetical protein